MQEIIFYDSKNVPYMTWYNFSYNQQNGILLFNVQFEYSIFNISECYKTNITQIINFEKELQDLYHGLSHKISFMSDDYLNWYQISLGISINMYILLKSQIAELNLHYI